MCVGGLGGGLERLQVAFGFGDLCLKLEAGG